MAARSGSSLADSRLCSSRAQKFMFGGLKPLTAETSLFIDVAGNIPFHKGELQLSSGEGGLSLIHQASIDKRLINN